MNHSRRHRFACCAALTGGLLISAAHGDEQGFTEPRQRIELAAPELATLSEVAVAPGDRVSAGQLICRLDSRSLDASLAAARARRDARGAIDAANARRNLRQEQFERVRDAHLGGHARDDELARAQAELEIATAELTSAKEGARIAAHEYDRIAVEIARRAILSPVAATVLEVRLEVGEAVTPSANIVAVLAVLDPLVIRLNISLERRTAIKIGQQVDGRCLDQPITATVTRIAPVADAATGTLAVELELANDNDRILSGTACSITL